MIWRWLTKLLGGTASPAKPAPALASEAELKSFENAFSDMHGGCRGVCHCGREFYNSDGGWTWEDGELEALRANPNATDLAWSVGGLVFERRTYVPDCPCWHARASVLIRFINAHGRQIADFLTEEKRRKVAEAARLPVVAEPLEKP